MIPISIVLADANELIPRITRDYLIYLAVAGAIDIRWSPDIWDEVTRNLVSKYRFTPERIELLNNKLDVALPRHMVNVDPEFSYFASLSGADQKDEHVVAAALTAQANVLLTENTKDFPLAWLKDRGILVLNLGELLSLVAEKSPAALRAAHKGVVQGNKGLTEAQILQTLATIVGAESFSEVSKALT